jgi:uncharacterized protein (TIGR03086 family)
VSPMDTTDTSRSTTAARPLEGTLPADDPRLAFAKAVALAGGVLDGVQPEQLDLPTPCPDVDVRTLQRHLVMVLQRVAAAGRGIPPFEWPTEPQLADDEVRGAWDAAAHDIAAVWTDDVLERTIALPWTTLVGAAVLAIYTNEVTVHTWDLATATGQRPAWDPDVLAVCEAAIHAELPDAERRAMWDAVAAQLPSGVPWADPFADAVDVPADASAIDRLVAWNGRQP